jgi:hypothetical protein
MRRSIEGPASARATHEDPVHATADRFIWEDYMRFILAIALTLSIIRPASASSQDNGGVDRDISQIMANLKSALGEESILEESDKKLVQINQNLINANDLLNSAEADLHKKSTDLKMREHAWEEQRQAAIDSGCPEKGGMVPTATAQRCEPLVRAANDERDKIVEETKDIAQQETTIKETRDKASEVTLTISAKRKAINSRLEELRTTKARLHMEAISALVAVADKKTLSARCNDLPDEKAHCCLSVIWDGSNPAQCDAELLFIAFEKAGVFQDIVVRTATKEH